MTVKEAAELIGVHKQTVLNWIKADKIKAKKIRKGALKFIYDVDKDSLLKHFKAIEIF